MEPVDVVQTYLELHNSHDVDGVMALLSSEIEFELCGVWTKRGKVAIRELEEFDATTDSYLALEGFELDGNIVSCRGVERNEWFRLAGLSEARYRRCAFTVEGEMIVRLLAQYEDESAQTIADGLHAITQWAQKHRPETLGELMPGGSFRYGQSAAKAWLSLLDEWRRSAT